MAGLDEMDEGDVTCVASREELLGARRARTSLHPCLVVVEGPSKGRIIRLKAPVTLGRACDAEVRIDEDGVSRRHACIATLPDGSVEIRDLGSTNGTRVNDEHVAQRVLRDGDRVAVGSLAVLKFTYHDAAEEALQQSLYEAATRDALTRVRNRRWLEEAMATEFAFAKRHQRALSLIMVDIDHFKRVNDTYGHPGGDAVLRGVADAIVRTVRREDAVARYGGEEFAILLRETALEAAVICAERVREAIGAQRVQHEGAVISVTASLGVATLTSRDAGALAVLLHDADQRLYAAKSGGRNRVVAR